MSEMKISPTDDYIWFNEDYTLTINGGTPKEAEIAAGKINNHDRMVEEIADLRKGLEIMIEQFESDHNCEYEYNIIRWNKDLLAKLSEGK